MFNHFHSFKLLPGVVSLISCVVFSGCYTDAPDSELLSSDEGVLNVVTRSVSSSPLQYPVSIYAFDQNGICRAEGTVATESENAHLNLGTGAYRITAIAGTSGFKFPSKIEQTSVISANDDNYSTSPLMMGHADVMISGQTNATLQMAVQVASVNMQLGGIPDNVSEVTVSFASQYSKINMNGELTIPLLSSISCTKENGIWKTGPLYLLPGSSISTVCTISLVDASGVNTYGYTYQSPLKAGTPYVLNGTFTEGFTFDGTIVASGWGDEVVLDFSFGPGVHETAAPDVNGDEDDKVVSSLPQPASLWNGYVVALVENTTEKEADLLLLSSMDWSGVYSAKSATNPDDAITIAKSYSERGLDDWRIPTKAEATALKSMYAGEKLLSLNELLGKSGYSLITDVETSSDNARYLCEDATYSFSLKSGNTTISAAGTTAKYHLRLVKKVHITVE